jgi:hypothetical protein
LEALADNEAALVDAEVVVARKLLEGGMEARNGGGTPSGIRREETEQIGSNRVGGVGSGPGRRRWERVSSHSQTAGDVGSGNSGVDRGLEEHRDGVGAESGAKCGGQTAAQIGYQRGGRDRSRP